MKIISISYNELLLYDEDADSEIGKIKSSMWTGKAEIFTQEAHYLIKSTGFWGVNKSLFHKEQALFSLKMGWSGNYEIRSLQEETSDFFTVKTKGFDYKHFYLLDKQENQLLKITMDFKMWSEADYELEFDEKIHSFADDNLLIYMTLSCVKNMLQMMYAA